MTKGSIMNDTINRSRASRGLGLIAATGITAGLLLLGATPAEAASLQRATFPDRVEFLGNESNSDVQGQVKFTVRPDGDWTIYSNTRNGRPALRYVHWTCELHVGSATIRTSTNTVKMKRKSNHTFNTTGNDVTVAALYDTIASSGGANCDIHFGK